MQKKINNVNELMIAAAKALSTGDSDLLDHLYNVVEGWIQSDEAAMAQLDLLDAIMEKIG